MGGGRCQGHRSSPQPCSPAYLTHKTCWMDFKDHAGGGLGGRGALGAPGWTSAGLRYWQKPRLLTQSTNDNNDLCKLHNRMIDTIIVSGNLALPDNENQNNFRSAISANQAG